MLMDSGELLIKVVFWANVEVHHLWKELLWLDTTVASMHKELYLKMPYTGVPKELG